MTVDVDEPIELPSDSSAGRRARLGPRWHRAGLTAAALAVGFVIALGLRSSGWFVDTRDTLEMMGFDPDRAQLLASLTAGAIAAAGAVLIFGTRRTGVVIAVATAAALFGHTLYTETRDALELHGVGGHFDPLGWGLTVLTLAVAAFGVGWATATLVTDIRGRIAVAGRGVSGAVRQRTMRGVGFGSVLGLVTMVVIVALTTPILGDILDYGPPTHMAQGASRPVALFGNGGTSATGYATTGSPGSTGSSDSTPLPGLQVSRGAVDPARPWTAWRPTGIGNLATFQLPAPWTGATRERITVSVYTPPGYDGSTRRYPVLIEVPWLARLWQAGASYTTVLDAAITSGELPPAITVFVDADGGPYPASECADTFDGREHFDTFASTTLVSWIDANYRTIPSPAARTVFGFSQGGFCAANLLLRHPGVFGQAVAFSGYFVAGLSTSQTLNAWRPWGRQQALIDANTPLLVAGRIAPSDRPRLFVVLTGSRTQWPYGPQLVAFAKALSVAGIPHAILPAANSHSWQAVRSDLPTAFALVAARQAYLGIFSGGR